MPSSPPPSAAPLVEDYAIVVGIQEYPHLNSLRGPTRDADEFETWLTRSGVTHVRRVVASAVSPVDARPRTDDVDTVFLDLIRAGRANDGQLGRRLYIYFSGHGVAPDLAADESALLMANAARDAIGYHIPGRLYASAVKLEGLFEEVVLLMDCCRDDYERFSIKPTPWAPVKSVRGGRTKHFFGFATRWGLKARERPIHEGRVDEVNGEYRGVFTTALLEALQGATRNALGQVTGTTVAAHVHNRVRELLAGLEFEKPQFDFDPGDDIVFATLAPAQPQSQRVEVRFSRATDMLVLLGPGGTATSVQRTEDTVILQLSSGLYVLRDTSVGGHEQGFQVLGDGVVYVDF